MCSPLINSNHLKVKLKTKKLVSQFAYGLVSLISKIQKMLRYNCEENDMCCLLKKCLKDLSTNMTTHLIVISN